MAKGIKLKVLEYIEGNVEELLEGNRASLPFLDAPFLHHWLKFWKGDFVQNIKKSSNYFSGDAVPEHLPLQG